MKLANNIKRGIAVIVIMGCVTAAAALAIAYKINRQHKLISKTAVIGKSDETVPKYDTVLMRKFKQVSAVLNIKDRSCTYSGVVNIIDKADTNQSVKNASFLMCKKDSNCYYKMGNTETINNGGIYMCIDHSNKKIFVGRQKSITLPDLVNSSGIKDALVNEHYTLSQKTNGALQTLILLNEKHITCKQYAVTYDTTDLKVVKIFARMTNFNAPLDKNKEKIVEVVFNSWEDDADINKYIDVKKILFEQDNKLRLTDAFKKYELVGVK